MVRLITGGIEVHVTCDHCGTPVRPARQFKAGDHFRVICPGCEAILDVIVPGLRAG
jgi:hypothetical protein